MTADFLREQGGVADVFGLRAGRLMGSPDRGRAECVQVRRVQALSIAMHVTLVVLIAAPMLTDIAGRSPGGARVKQWVRFELPAGIRTLTEPRAKPALIRGGGSGGDREASPESVGRLAPFQPSRVCAAISEAASRSAFGSDAESAWAAGASSAESGHGELG